MALLNGLSFFVVISLRRLDVLLEIKVCLIFFEIEHKVEGTKVACFYFLNQIQSQLQQFLIHKGFFQSKVPILKTI